MTDQPAWRFTLKQMLVNIGILSILLAGAAAIFHALNRAIDDARLSARQGETYQMMAAIRYGQESLFSQEAAAPGSWRTILENQTGYTVPRCENCPGPNHHDKLVIVFPYSERIGETWEEGINVLWVEHPALHLGDNASGVYSPREFLETVRQAARSRPEVFHSRLAITNGRAGLYPVTTVGTYVDFLDSLPVGKEYDGNFSAYLKSRQP
ncbi:type II secretion system protein [Blastopirellula marina]|uniref:type II secretion system protein n=1 Tax=Blastopirellula marina TaxID=124 RepID=UPI0011B02FEB|nr:hypothetical protein [Blastopirellula marina]